MPRPQATERALLWCFVLEGCFTTSYFLKTDCEKVVDHAVMALSKGLAVSEEQKSGSTTYKSPKILLEPCYENFWLDEDAAKERRLTVLAWQPIQ